MSTLLKELAAAPPWALLLAAFVVPALAASTLLGLVVPGETAVLIAGVLAHEGRVPLVAVMAAAVLGAITGDSVGYAVGARLGPALFSRISGRAARRLGEARAFVRRFGGLAVVLGRWAAFLRTLVPSIAGASGLPYRRFVAFIVAGATLWGVGVAGAGYLLGAAYGRAEGALGLTGTLGALVLVVGALLVTHYLSRRAEARLGRDESSDGDAAPSGEA
ncbi:DedA family protein [Pseudonocardia sp. T1-2H]|uniref:DedA family protein n=1 Tax=Pseudonocardia sp. T1-2H TaxID=3128899 RepID=UPI0031013B05